MMIEGTASGATLVRFEFEWVVVVVQHQLRRVGDDGLVAAHLHPIETDRV